MVGAKKSSINGWAHILLLLLLSSMWVSGNGTQVSAPTPTSMDCSPALLSLADCVTFVEEGSKEVKPQGKCCSGLKRVVKKEVGCLCQAFKGSADFGVTLNMTKALTLPSACGVKTPPFSKCNIAVGVAVPGAAPALSPVGAPASSPSAEQSIARVPAPSPATSAPAALSAPSAVLLLTIVAALFSNHL